MNDFVNFVDLVFFRENYFNRKVFSICFCFSCLEVVFLSCCYSEHFCLINFDLSSSIDKKICLVLFVFVVYLGCLVGFMCLQQCYVHICDNN